MFHSSQDVSGVTSLLGAFAFSTFNGAIDQWDVSNVQTLESAFEVGSFNGDISDWVGLCCSGVTHGWMSAYHFIMCIQDISKVTSLRRTFVNSSFVGVGGIDQWDTSMVETLERAFASSIFTGDVSDWVSELQPSLCVCYYPSSWFCCLLFDF